MTDDVDSDQFDFWNGEHGVAWARHAAVVDTMFAELTEAVLDGAGIGVGDRILDLACGAGGTTLAAADRATPIGSVAGIDISAPMIDVARERLYEAGAGNVTLILGDAATYPFAAQSFDALVSRLGAMFFDDPAAAFAQLRAALAPGARVCLGVWRTPRENPWAMEPISAARDFIEMPPRPGPEEPGPFSFAEPDRVQRVLGAAGFDEVALAPLDLAIPLGAGVDDALAFTMEMGPLAAPLTAATGRNRERAVAAIRDCLAANLDADGTVRLGGGCWLVTARAP